jgi:hypothetical protein
MSNTQNPCPQCGGQLLIGVGAPAIPTYPVYSDVPPVTEYHCNGCGERWVREGAGLARTVHALATARHLLVKATQGER